MLLDGGGVPISFKLMNLQIHPKSDDDIDDDANDNDDGASGGGGVGDAAASAVAAAATSRADDAQTILPAEHHLWSHLKQTSSGCGSCCTTGRQGGTLQWHSPALLTCIKKATA